MNTIDKFYTRLSKIGVEVELGGNFPWVYLRKVNGVSVVGKFESRHGFTAFFMNHKNFGGAKFSNRRVVFKKVREALNDQKKTT